MPSLLGFSLFSWTLANLCASLFMTGVIWFVQIVHYPLFAKVGCGEFAEYERRHADLTGYVVAPVMLFELAASFVLAYLARQTANATLGYAALGLVVVAWLSTFGLQVPCHNRLSKGFSSDVHLRLVRTNWLRTISWTARTVVLLTLLLRIAR